MLADRLRWTRTDTSRPFFVGSTEQSPIAREVFTEDMKCSQSYSIEHGPSFGVST